ncbi:hypothetical protein LCGC14_0679930 [marine sediment metagenome]|uniref:Uncharacterized protein n=1 Tax=marine sediment metagenome TaxID=412755 RepID=A0A0F9QNN1_9ZZZZ
MRRKIWIKRRRNSVKLDWRKTMRMWTINIIAVVVVALLWVSLAHAQPELKVGQEVAIHFGYDLSLTPICYGRVVFVYTDEIGLARLPNDNVLPNRCRTVRRESVTGYRILKPAPRPEFKLPNVVEYEKCQQQKKRDEKEPPPSKFGVDNSGFSFPCQKIYSDDFDAIAKELRWLREGIKGLKK